MSTDRTGVKLSMSWHTWERGWLRKLYILCLWLWIRFLKAPSHIIFGKYLQFRHYRLSRWGKGIIAQQKRRCRAVSDLAATNLAPDLNTVNLNQPQKIATVKTTLIFAHHHSTWINQFICSLLGTVHCVCLHKKKHMCPQIPK